MSQDKRNYLYFVFLTPIVQEYEKVNSAFQTSKPNVDELHSLLEMLFRSMKSRIYDQNQMLHLKRIDFGHKFKSELEKHNLSDEDKNAIQENCKNFIVEAVKETEKRVPSSTKILALQKALHPKQILHLRVPFENLPFKQFMKNPDTVEVQYRNFLQFNFDEEGIEIGQNVDEFWTYVANVSRNEEFIFKDLAYYVFAVFSIPCSNAFVERVFSQLNYVKNRLRNQMNIDTVDSILFLKSHLQAFKNYIDQKSFS